jgi:alpha-glutamyl/putrescinyl thymine pyrophosphorylase-like protein
MFCRHNRLTSKCAICSRELDDNLRKQAPVRATAPRATSSTASRTRRNTSSRPGGVVTRKLARAADDGYRNPLVPGLRATADAERLAAALTAAAARLEPPGPYPDVATEPDIEQATFAAFLLALGEGEHQRTVDAYQAWVERAGSQEAAFTGEESWTPERRFGRVFERLALPGFTRGARYDLLVALGAAGRYPLAADSLHFVEDDATTLAAKRLLVSGDRLLLERRAKELADAAALPLAALDRGLAVWGTPAAHVDRDGDIDEGIAAALALT